MIRFNQWIAALLLSLAFSGAHATVITQSNEGDAHAGKADANHFGLHWASIDSYNTASFFLGGILADTFLRDNPGDDNVVAATTDNQLSSASGRFMTLFFNSQNLDDARLITNLDTFADGSQASATVARPDSLVLTAIALIGLLMAHRHRR